MLSALERKSKIRREINKTKNIQKIKIRKQTHKNLINIRDQLTLFNQTIHIKLLKKTNYTT